MVVHPGHGNYSGTLINGLLYHFDNLPNNSSNRPGLVHRIDKDTSGLLVIAKTEKSMTILAKQFFKKSVEREYLALVWGDIKNDEGQINAPIGRNPKNSELVQIPKKKAIRWKMSKALFIRLNKNFTESKISATTY